MVKLLRADRRDDPRVRQAVLLEGHLATTLAHPHLVRGYDVLDDPPTVVLETLRGATLSALVEHEPLDLADAAELGCQLASVLGYLHRQAWLHLDLKPDNVVVDHGKAVLIDLSLAGRPGSGRPVRDPGLPRPGAGDRSRPVRGDRRVGAGHDARRRARPHRAVRRRGHVGEPTPVAAAPPADAAGARRSDEVPDEVRDLLAACVSLDPAARPLLEQVRAALEPLRSPAPAVDDVRASLRRAGDPGAPVSVWRWPTVIAPTGAWSSGMPNASRKPSRWRAAMPKKQAPSPSSTAVCRISSAAMPVSMSQ